MPTKVVAFTGLAAALYDYGVEVAAVFGPTTLADGAPDIQAGRMPVEGLDDPRQRRGASSTSRSSRS